MLKARKGFTLVEVLTVVGIISMLAAVAIPNLIATKRTANESAAKSNLRSLASAAETASISLGHYPTNVAEYVNYIASAQNFCADLAGAQTAFQGYNYSCTMDVSGYTLVASPVILGTSGNITYTATTGVVITPL